MCLGHTWAQNRSSFALPSPRARGTIVPKQIGKKKCPQKRPLCARRSGARTQHPIRMSGGSEFDAEVRAARHDTTHMQSGKPHGRVNRAIICVRAPGQALSRTRCRPHPAESTSAALHRFGMGVRLTSTKLPMGLHSALHTTWESGSFWCSQPSCRRRISSHRSTGHWVTFPSQSCTFAWRRLDPWRHGP